MTKNLMIVDDRTISRLLVRQAAALPEDTVLECTSPEEALKAAGIFKPDCVVMGVSQSSAVALQAIKSIRESYPQVRVVALSSLPDPGLRRMASEAGASGYVTTDNLSELFLLAAPERLTRKPARKSPARRPQKHNRP